MVIKRKFKCISDSDQKHSHNNTTVTDAEAQFCPLIGWKTLLWLRVYTTGCVKANWLKGDKNTMWCMW